MAFSNTKIKTIYWKQESEDEYSDEESDNDDSEDENYMKFRLESENQLNQKRK